MSESRAAKRHRWRLPCEIVFEGGRQRGFVLDLSENGLFVQVRAPLRPGATVEVILTLDGAEAPLQLRAHVARSKQVPTQLASVARGGVGLSLQRAPQDYLDALAKLQGGAALRATIAPEAVACPAPPAAQRFRVRVQQSDGPRSRTLEIVADTPEQARAKALRESGAGWDAVRVEAIAS